MPAPELKMIRNRIPATSDDPMPMRIVSPMVIGSGPGRARRPRPPTIAPHTQRKMMKARNAMEDLRVGPSASAAGMGAPAAGEPQVEAAEDQQREDEPGHDPEDRPDEEADHQPADDADADGPPHRP